MSGDHNQFQKPKSYLDDMNKVRKALEMALEALEGNCTNPSADPEQAASEDAAITAIKEALAQPEQEPVAWANTLDFDDDDIEIIPARAKGKLGTSNCDIPLYTAPPKRELTCVCGAVWEGETMVHSPPKKEWVGLTDEEINSVCYKRDWTAPWTNTTFARAIEAKLKEKNHG